MSEETPEQVIKSLVETLTLNNSDREATRCLDSMSLLTQNLEPFDQVLNQITNPNSYSVIIPMLKNLMEKRGCLLSVQVLTQHLEYLCNIFNEKAALINSVAGASNIFAGLIAISYRFLLQTSLQERDPKPFPFIFEKLSSNDVDRSIALTTLCRIVTNIKENQYQLTDTKHLDFKSFFYRNMLRSYFECTFPFMENPNDPTIIQTLDLLLACLQFTTHNDDMLMFRFNVPGDWVDFYTDTSIPERLFRIYAESSTEAGKKALDALLLFSSAVDSTWKAMDQQIIFIKTIAAQLKEAILKEGIFENVTEEADLEFSRLICKIGMVLPLQHFITDGASAEFFDAIRKYTEDHFTQMKFEEDTKSQTICSYMLTFWGKTAATCSISPQSYDGDLLALFPAIFNNFVSSYLDNVTDTLLSDIDDPETLMPQFESLWNLTLIAPKDCVDTITAKVNEAIAVMQSGESVDQAIIRLAILVTMIASRFSIRSNNYYRSLPNQEQSEQKAELVGDIFNIINTTNGEVLASLVSSFPNEISILEKTIVVFAKTFKRDMFTLKPDVRAVYEAMGLGEEGRKVAFDLFVNRFIDDLTYFQGNYNILYQILIYIDDISNSSCTKDVKELTASNEAIQNLVQRKVAINFAPFEGEEDVSLKHQKKLITLLNTIYARIIPSIDALKVFLSFIDSKFTEMSKTSPAYGDPMEVFTVFSEIRGILHGCAQIPHFVYVARWYLNNYVDVAVHCLELHGDKSGVCRAIIQSWGCIAANKGLKLVFPSGSCDGIRVFKASLSIIQVTLEKVQDPDVQISILKMINSSVTQTYCNFGVMKFFNDNAPDVMIQTFFDFISQIPLADICDKYMMAAVTSITSIVNVFGSEILPNDSYRAVALAYLKTNIRETKKIDTWKACCKALTAILACASSNEGLEGVFDELRPHFIILLDNVINESTSLVDNACGPFYLMATRASEFVSSTLGVLINAFDPDNQPKVNEIVDTFTSQIPQGDVLPLDPPKQFRFALSKFKIDMVRFPISVLNIPDFAELFEEEE